MPRKTERGPDLNGVLYNHVNSDYSHIATKSVDSDPPCL
jgi:hypothetical protein